jgi:hypothetical protein
LPSESQSPTSESEVGLFTSARDALAFTPTEFRAAVLASVREGLRRCRRGQIARATHIDVGTIAIAIAVATVR